MERSISINLKVLFAFKIDFSFDFLIVKRNCYKALYTAAKRGGWLVNKLISKRRTKDLQI